MSNDELYSRIISFDNLYQAYRRVRLSKRYYLAQQKYEFKLEPNLAELSDQLQDPRRYQPKPYHRFVVAEPKQRQIAAPEFADRIVHQALVFIIQPFIIKHFIDTTYACIKNRGTHKAVMSVRASLDTSATSAYYFKSDIRQYFASVNHAILKKLLRKYLADEKTLILLDKIVDSYREEDGDGIPIGNLTSQLFANLYLNELDHFVVDQKLNYFRYMDDFLLIEKDKNRLLAARDGIIEFLKTNLRLELHPKKRLLQRVALGVDFCGYNLFPGRTVLRKTTLRRFVRRYKGRRKKIEKMERTLSGLLMPELNQPLAEKIESLKAALALGVLSHCGFLKYSEQKTVPSGFIYVNKIRLPYL